MLIAFGVSWVSDEFFAGLREKSISRSLVSILLTATVAAVSFGLSWWITSWVFHRHRILTVSEIEGTKSPSAPVEKLFVPPEITPQYLVHFYGGDATSAQGDTAVKPFVGKWMRFRGPVGDVANDELLGQPMAILYFYTPYPNKKIRPLMIQATGVGSAWVERVTMLPQGADVVLIGRIYNVGHGYVSLQDCQPEDR